MSYPLPGYRFAVSLDPVERVPAAERGRRRAGRHAVGAFSDVTGLSGELEVLPHPEGGQNTFVHQLPVRHTWGRITLKKGVVRDRSLWDWFRAGLGNALGARRDGSIVLYDAAGQAAVTWAFKAGLAAKWTGPELTARDGAIAVESLEIVHQGLDQIVEGEA